MQYGGIWVYKNSAWREISSPQVLAGTVWKPAEMVWVDTGGGSWRNVFATNIPDPATFKPGYPKTYNGKILIDVHMNATGNSGTGDYTAIMTSYLNSDYKAMYYPDTAYTSTATYNGQNVAVTISPKNARGFGTSKTINVPVVGPMNTFTWNSGSPYWNSTTGKYDGYLYWGTVANATGYDIVGSSSGSVGQVNTFYVTGMSGGTNPTWTITPKNAYGTGTPLSFSPTLPAPIVAPGAPTNVSMYYNSGTQFVVNFGAPVTGGTPTSYNIWIFGPNGSWQWTVGGAGTYGLSVSAITAGNYYARITASNVAGTSGYAYSNTVTFSVPSAPSYVSTYYNGGTQFIINFGAASGATYYQIWIFGPGVSASATVTGAGTYGLSTPSLPSGYYYARVDPYNSYGLGPYGYSANVYIAPPDPVPAMPTNPYLFGEAWAGQQLTAAWTGSLYATYYEVEILRHDYVTLYYRWVNNQAGNIIGFPEATYPRDYWVRVRAGNNSGVSGWRYSTSLYRYD